MRKILVITAVILIAVSCDKDQRAVKKLDGRWDATKMLVGDEGGKSVDIIALGSTVEYVFDGCELVDNEFCDVSVSTTTLIGTDTLVPTEIIEGKFKISGNGSIMTITDTEKTDSTYRTFEILELKKKTCSLKQTSGSGNIEVDLVKL